MKSRVRVLTGAFAVLSSVALSASGVSTAEPPSFPDLASLNDVTSEYLGHTPRDADSFHFATADGYWCGGDSRGVSCFGQLPGLQDLPFGPMQGPCEVGDARAYGTGSAITRNHRDCPSATTFKVLNAGQKVTLGSAVCGVLPGDITACTNGTHGFVLDPSGSWTF